MYQGLNDRIQISFCPGKEGGADEVITANEWTLNQIGERMLEVISVGKVGAYLVDDKIKYYFVKWTSLPWVVDVEYSETKGGVARRGEWVCSGICIWLNDVTLAPHWYWISKKGCC